VNEWKDDEEKKNAVSVRDDTLVVTQETRELHNLTIEIVDQPEYDQVAEIEAQQLSKDKNKGKIGKLRFRMNWVKKNMAPSEDWRL
jgi:hypothetical protein